VDLTAIEGIDEIHALTLISELGSDFTKWPTVKHFTSWLGLCPNFRQTGGKVKSSRTRRGEGTRGPCVASGGVVADAEQRGVGRVSETTARPTGRAEGDHGGGSQAARIVYHLMRYGEAYVKQTEKQYAAEVRERQEKQLKRRAKELGFELKKVEPALAG
jgi:hypothetical protein